MLNDLWGHNVAFAHLDPVTAMAHLKKLRALATSSKERFVSLPDIPSASEAGITNSDIVGWWSVHMPKGMPKPILDQLETLFNQIAVDEETKPTRAVTCEGSNAIFFMVTATTSAWPLRRQVA